MVHSPPGPSVHGIPQPRTLEWVPFPSPGDLWDPGIKFTSPTLAGRLPRGTWEALVLLNTTHQKHFVKSLCPSPILPSYPHSHPTFTSVPFYIPSHLKISFSIISKTLFFVVWMVWLHYITGLIPPQFLYRMFLCLTYVCMYECIYFHWSIADLQYYISSI